MNKETLRMQMLSGIITESEYKAKLKESKKPLNENFVGMGMVGNIFDREKTDYELAFEHFTKGTSILKEGISSTEVEDYLTGLFDQIDLGDEYEEGPQTFTFEKSEYADEDLLGGEEAAMFIPTHEYLSSKGEITITDPMSGAPVTFSTEGEDIVASWNTEDFSELDEVKKTKLEEAHPLEGGPGYMTKHHAGVLTRLIHDLEKEDTSKFSESNLENYEKTLSSLKAALEASKAKYKEETGKDL